MKRILFCCLFSFCCLCCRAQSLQEMNEQLMGMYTKGEFENAIPLALKALEQAKKEFGISTGEYANSLNKLATLYMRLSQYEKARPLYIQAMDIRKQVLGDDSQDYANSLNNLAALYLATKEFYKAEPLFLRSAAIRKQKLGENDPEYINSLNNLILLYRNMNRPEKVEPLYQEMLAIIKKTEGEETPNYDAASNGLASFYIEQKNYEKAEYLLLNSLALRKSKLGTKDTGYVLGLNALARLYEGMKDYNKAASYFTEVLGIVKQEYGEADPAYAICLNDLGYIAKNLKQYLKAIEYFKESMAVIMRTKGEANLDYGVSANSLAILYMDAGLYGEADTLFSEVTAVRKKYLGINDPEYANSLYNQAKLNEGLNRFEKAASFYIQVKEIRKKILGEEHEDYLLVLNNLGNLYVKMQQYDLGEALINNVMDIQKRVLGQSHAGYANTITLLANLYMVKGDFQKAELLFIQAMEIREQTLGKMNEEYSAALQNLATLYLAVGQYEKSLSLYTNAQDILKKTTGEDDLDYALVLNNLGALYMNLRQFEKAIPMFMDAARIRMRILGSSHPEYATCIGNLAAAYGSLSQFDKALPFFIEVTEILKKTAGINNLEYGRSLNNLGSVYCNIGLNEKALPLFLESLQVLKNIDGENTASYAIYLDNLTGVYGNLQQYEKAEPLILQKSKIIRSNLQNNFINLSENEKGKYLTNKGFFMEADNSFLYNYKKASPAVLQNNFEQQLFYKSLTLSETKNMLSALEQNKDTLLQAVFKAWKAQKKELARQYALPLNNRSPEIKQMETRAENLEKELGRRSVAFSKQKKELAVSMADVQQHLQKDEVAIEFVRFQLINTKWTDSIIYAAYLLNSYDAVPKFIPLCEEKQLGKYFSLTGGAANIKAIYRSEVIDETETASLSGDSLYSLIWKPLMPYLKGIKKVNYAPAGLLYKVAFHALPYGDSLLLMDRFELNQYGSVRQLALVSEKEIQNNSIALFGDCTYSMDSTDLVKNITDAEKVNTLITASGDRSDYAGGWKELEGTAGEIDAIQVLCTQNKTTTRLYNKVKATEEQFKLLSGNSPSVIHLATHGFFLPDPAKKREAGFNVDSRNAFTLADDPLLRSGIVLSGANRVWAGKPPIAGCEDGIVTAYEIAQMDLNKTDLVVLSACETALGDIKGSEGVFGLQRAFKLAGVKNMLLSLWKVPDAETAELMKIFYSHYLQGKTTREAFSAAQQEMRKRYKPYYWAAFVLIE